MEFDSAHICCRGKKPQSSIAEYIESLTRNNISTLLKLTLWLNVLSTYSFSPPTELETILPLYNLKKISIDNSCIDGDDFSIPNDEFLLYIMKKAPNLISLTIQLPNRSRVEVEHSENSTLQSIKVIIQFFNYICKIPHCYLQDVVASENISIVIQSIFSNCADIKTAREVLLDNIDIGFCDPKNLDEELEDTEPLKAAIDYNTYDERQTVGVKFNTYNATYLYQVLQVIEQAGQYFRRVSIQLSLTGEAPSVVKRIVRCCPKLKRLKISCDFTHHHPPPLERDLLNEEENTTTTPTHNFDTNPKKLVFSKCIPFGNQFRSVLDHFPHLKTLTIEDFFISQQQHLYFLFDMPNTSLKNFKIELKNGLLKDTIKINSIYIKLITGDGQNTRYYFMVNKNKNNNNFQKFKLLENPAESEYQESICTKNILSFEIRCKSLKSFQITVAPHTTHTLCF